MTMGVRGLRPRKAPTPLTAWEPTSSPGGESRLGHRTQIGDNEEAMLHLMKRRDLLPTLRARARARACDGSHAVIEPRTIPPTATVRWIRTCRARPLARSMDRCSPDRQARHTDG